MKIKWFGHACFLITTSKGTKILTDPFDGSVGYDVPETEADIVTISHSHRDHSYTGKVSGKFRILDSPGKYEADDAIITGTASYHDKTGGSRRGGNIIFKICADGLDICHCGDIGHVLNGEQKEMIGKVDVLMVPVGGFFTVGSREAFEIVTLLRPKAVIPMHFKTEKTDLPIDDERAFMAMFEDGIYPGCQEIEINRMGIDDLPGAIRLEFGSL